MVDGDATEALIVMVTGAAKVISCVIGKGGAPQPICQRLTASDQQRSVAVQLAYYKALNVAARDANNRGINPSIYSR